ncbi:MAG: pyridoxal-phosphate dependent enzyme [Bacteroidetes bacterium]|nr:pyridoxal-phosphate dependent enzyme [Bacteroidota bacterium]HET6245360.1 pyridoxal-phosphate dependent enzyme [Bacteroidia bacterium]
MYYNNILETIGNTPLVKLNNVTKGIKATVLAKVETFNPGNSIKDRMALKMIEDAEKAGLIKPGGTIIEGTSGNTGMGLALACIVKGYRLICTMPDKQSKEKMDILRAVGAEVVVTPTNVTPEDPRSYYSVARRLASEIPNSYYPNQYDNLSNTAANYEQTGPEIWEQTEGKITHLVVGVGTGGTLSGAGKYLKEKNPNIKIWGIDTYGSVFKKYKETGIFDENEIYSYLTEGIGEDILPKNVDFDVVDHFEKVTDKDGMVMTREIARKEGIFVGNSAGCAVAGLLQMKDQLKEDDLVVIIFHDHGSRYIGKIFNDDWMRERGFLEKASPLATDLIENHKNEKLITADANQSVAEVMYKMTRFNISQIPVIKNGEFVGSISDNHLLGILTDNPELKKSMVEEIMQTAFPIVSKNAKMEDISKLINKNNAAVLVKLDDNSMHIVTKHDLINAIAR